VHDSVPFATPPSGRMVAPLLTWQIWWEGPAVHAPGEGSLDVSTPAG
jgi:hypothetical protein